MNKALFYHSYSRANSFFQNTEYAARLSRCRRAGAVNAAEKEIPAEVFTQIYRPRFPAAMVSNAKLAEGGCHP